MFKSAYTVVCSSIIKNTLWDLCKTHTVPMGQASTQRKKNHNFIFYIISAIQWPLCTGTYGHYMAIWGTKHSKYGFFFFFLLHSDCADVCHIRKANILYRDCFYVNFDVIISYIYLYSISTPKTCLQCEIERDFFLYIFF